MARIRSIKPTFFTSEDVCQLCPLARLLYQGLWCEADRTGRLEDRPVQLKIRLLPVDDCDVDALLWDLAAAHLIRRYTARDGRDYIHVIRFLEHQRPHPKEPESVIPTDGIDREPRSAVEKNGGQVMHADHVSIDYGPRSAVKKNGGQVILPGSIPSSPVGMDLEISDPDRSTGNAAGGGGAAPLITSPLAYQRRLQHCAYVGARLDVPKVLHVELRKSLGGPTAEADLMGWYADLDAELEMSGEALPDVWGWLRGRFRAWGVATSRAAAVPEAPKPGKPKTDLRAVAAAIDAANAAKGATR